MPVIRQYNAPTTRLSPSPEGTAAWETAGRRIGPLYNQAAQDVREGGRLQAQEAEDLARWPFNMLDLAQRNADTRNASSRKGGNAGVVFGGGGGGRGARPPSAYQPFNEINYGAPRMAGVAASLVSGSGTEQAIDPNTGLPVPTQQGPMYTLQNGQLVKVGSKQDSMVAPNQDAMSAAQEWYNSQGQVNLTGATPYYTSMTDTGNTPTLNDISNAKVGTNSISEASGQDSGGGASISGIAQGVYNWATGASTPGGTEPANPATFDDLSQ